MRQPRAGLRAALTAIAIALVLALAGCATGPAYQPPPTPMPVAWKIEPPWRESAPADAAPKGSWWLRFGDAELDALQRQALANNATLQIASARLAQARAQVAGASAGLFPQIGLGARVQRLKSSANRPLSNYASPNVSTVQDDYALALTVNYEVDLASRVASSIEAVRASAEQSTIDLENTRLLLTADLATAYFNLRGLDAELDVLARSIALQRRALQFVTARHDGGATSGLDVAQQQALLDNTLTQVDVLRRQRDPFEHAIATLTGTPAPLFTLAPDADPQARIGAAPSIALGVPSDVLERRPDVASAERAMAAANAQIGVARAAFYPSILLAPSLGVDSRELASLFNAPSLLWSLGVTATQTLFDGGRLRANVDFAAAGYDATVANYRRVVLTAMQEVEDGITGLAALERATAQANAAVASSRRVLDMATSRYEGGATTYLDVINAQQALLGVERQATQLASQRRVTSVFLIKALGGDWEGAAQRQSRAN
ncbi:efflux transporter outer membrane subunit [Rhizobacter sp. Root404]|uniref:efflux transporter outer membrane subunit n=1 Tax=Rhizobacter sp. Root404 TaxID=1736528 RepID=UPI000A67DDE6|nr:efflux transporter outer membrane subunit [Rhizobacter sp. Root404]